MAGWERRIFPTPGGMSDFRSHEGCPWDSVAHAAIHQAGGRRDHPLSRHPAPPGLWCSGVYELPSDGLRLIAPVIPIFANVLKLCTQQTRRVMQRRNRDLRLEGRCGGYCVPLRYIVAFIGAQLGGWIDPMQLGGFHPPGARVRPSCRKSCRT